MYGARMLAKTETESAATAAGNWLAQFERALAEPDDGLLKTLFHADSHWRDVLALSWDIKTVDGSDAILRELQAHVGRARPVGSGSLPIGVRPARSCVRAPTRWRRSSGLKPPTVAVAECCGSPQMPTTAIRSKPGRCSRRSTNSRGSRNRSGRSRPQGKAYSRDFRGPNWLDLRKAAAEYADREPAVLVVGGGQAGLAIAARLTQLGVDTLIVDREARIGDNWRNRYHALVLHNQVHVNHLPYMPFPPNWPAYIPKDKLAAWFEAYAESMELNYWTATEFEGGTYDEKAGRWTVVLRRADDTKREMHPRHVVLATGVSGIPMCRTSRRCANFGGTILHSSQYDDGDAWKRQERHRHRLGQQRP